MIEKIAFACGFISIISLIVSIWSIFFEFNENIIKGSMIIATISWFMMIMLGLYGV